MSSISSKLSSSNRSSSNISGNCVVSNISDNSSIDICGSEICPTDFSGSNNNSSSSTSKLLYREPLHCSVRHSVHRSDKHTVVTPVLRVTARRGRLSGVPVPRHVGDATISVSDDGSYLIDSSTKSKRRGMKTNNGGSRGETNTTTTPPSTETVSAPPSSVDRQESCYVLGAMATGISSHETKRARDGTGSSGVPEGFLYVWGDNNKGQLLHDEGGSRSDKPHRLHQFAQRKIASVYCGRESTWVVSEQGAVWAGGNNE